MLFSYVILKEIIQYEIMTHHCVWLSTSLLILRNFAFQFWQPESSITVKDVHFSQSNCISLASRSLIFSSELSIQSDKLLMDVKALRYVGILKLCQQNETEVLGHMLSFPETLYAIDQKLKYGFSITSVKFYRKACNCFSTISEKFSCLLLSTSQVQKPANIIPY